MSLWDRVTQLLALEPMQERTILASPFSDMPDLDTQLANIRRQGARPWRMASINEALGVPAIQRAVSLIANTTGMLAIQGFRDGLPMEDTPQVVLRPDPYSTPRDFYRDVAYQMATRGETVQWIAKRDRAGYPAALIIVPLAELTVEENERNRLFPVYKWGKIEGTRFSAANPRGEFVHVTYMKEPGELRGKGPLQMCGAAVSVAVEAQEWAANFYAEGGTPSTVIKSSIELDEDEAEALRSQWVNKPHNVPRIIDPGIEDVETFDVNAQGSQMLDSREHQNGDAARMYGIPGSLLDYRASGSNLTYQNIEMEFTKFVRTCLAPNYLEPIEQAYSDLLPRSTVARFSLEGFLRADIKTRFEVYGMAIPVFGQQETADWARQQEGFTAGNVELAPVPFAPPSAVPASLPQLRSEHDPVRCDGMRTFRRSGVTSLGRCNAKLAESGPFVGTCRKCKKVYRAA